jgi:hypothetical protein
MKAVRSSVLLLTMLLMSATSASTQTKSSCQIQHPTLTAKQCNSVKAWVGMSIDQLHQNWGLPDHVNHTSSRSGESYQLIYKFGEQTDVVYFDNSNTVTTIQFETTEEKRLEALENKIAVHKVMAAQEKADLAAKAAKEKAALAAEREWEAGEPARKAAAAETTARQAREQVGRSAAEAAHCAKLSDKTREILGNSDAIEAYERYNKQNCGMVF